jgi:hypothetical protein
MEIDTLPPNDASAFDRVNDIAEAQPVGMVSPGLMETMGLEATTFCVQSILVQPQ